jgi:hypothetical protein
MQDPLLQTRVPAEVFERVREVAEEQGDTIAAWLLDGRSADPTGHFVPGNHDAPTHFPEPVREHGALERTFLVVVELRSAELTPSHG